MWRRLVNYVVLPAEVTAFERTYLGRLNRIALYFFFAHLPVFVLIAALCGTGPLSAAILTALVLVGPVVTYFTTRNPRLMSVMSGFTAMCLGGLLVHFGRGPMQIEMHFYFFVLIALLAVFANPSAVITAAITVALHHLVMFIVLPRSVFNYDASYFAVIVHAVFVVLESVAACFVARSFFDNVIGLERIVEHRTRELDRRNRALRLVLDNVEQGFVTLSLEGRADRERSAVLDRWLGDGLDDGPIWEAMKRLEPSFGEWFATAWAMIPEDALPLEVAIDQLPKRLVSGDRVWSLAYRIIAGGDVGPDKVLLVMSDVTAEVSRERGESEQRDFHRVFNHMMRDRTGFLDFFREAEGLVKMLENGLQASLDQRRVLHTLKGNCGLFGLSRLVGLCHDLETAMEDGGEPLTEKDAERIGAEWRTVAHNLEEALGGDQPHRIEVEEVEIDRALAEVREAKDPALIAQRLLGWKLEPIERRFRRFATQAQALALRQGKGNIEISVEANDLRLEPMRWGEFWAAFAHALRNAVDHGLETPEERRHAGKDTSPHLRLASWQRTDALVIEISDDGRGIDWNAVHSKAEAAGLPCASPSDLTNALFANGLTTRTEASEISGRGIGMGALRAACQKLGGQIEVLSSVGQGTTLRFSWPRERSLD